MTAPRFFCAFSRRRCSDGGQLIGALDAVADEVSRRLARARLPITVTARVLDDSGRFLGGGFSREWPPRTEPQEVRYWLRQVDWPA